MQFSGPLAKAVTPKEMITKDKSYHNEISGVEAIKRLKAFGNHHYLTRHSEVWKCYVLSVYMSNEDLENEKYKHFPLKVSGEGIRIQEDKTFENLEKMLKYYQNNRLDPAFPTIGECITEKGYEKKAKQIREQQEQPQQAQPQAQAQVQQPQPQAQAQVQQEDIQVLQHQIAQLQAQAQAQAQAQPQAQPQAQAQVQQEDIQVLQQQIVQLQQQQQRSKCTIL